MNPQIFGAGVQQRSRWVCAQRRVNALFELADAGAADRAQVTIYGRPGLTLHSTLGEAPIRGMYAVGSEVYAVQGARVYLVYNNGTLLLLGTLGTTEGAVYWAHGHLNAAGDQYLMLVDGAAGYTWNLIDLVWAQITDADFPAAPEACTYINGYFVVNRGGTGQWFISGLDDATAWDALDFETAAQAPDDLLRPLAYQGVLGLFGEYSTEFWGYTGDAAFPFARLYATAQDWGVAARASLAPFGEAVIGLMQNRLGEAVVALVTAGGIQPVAPPDLVVAIAGYVQRADAVGAALMVAGHPLYLLTFPNSTAAGVAHTWCYDRASGVWGEWESGADGGAFLAWCAAPAVGRIYLGGRTSGKIYILDDAVHTDAGAVLPVDLVSRHINGEGGRMMICAALELDIESGAGTGAAGQGSAPEALLSVSRDGGRSFGPARAAEFGAQGEYRQRCRWQRLGAGRDFVFRVRITDPVRRVITGEAVRLLQGAA